MRANPVGWFEIYVEDMDRARQFYEAVFAVKLERLHSTMLEMWAFPIDHKARGAPGALVKYEKLPPGGNSTVVYLSCEDCAVEEARAAKSGGRVHRGKISIGEYGFISLIFDTEGNLFGLHSLR